MTRLCPQVKIKGGVFPCRCGVPAAFRQCDKTKNAVNGYAIQNEPSYLNAYLLFGEIYEERLDYSAAAAVYRDALKIEQLPPPLRRQLAEKVRAIESHRRQGEGR